MSTSRSVVILVLGLLTISTRGFAGDPQGDEAPSGASPQTGAEPALSAAAGGEAAGQLGLAGPAPAAPSSEIGAGAAEVVSEATAMPENSVARCEDGKDNDGDGHLDCDDQDCQIFAICVLPPKESAPREKAVAESPPPVPLLRRPFSVGFFPGVTTDGGAEGIVLNHFTLNFIGMGDRLRGAELSALGAIRRDDVIGYQSAGLFNINWGATRGYQAAGLVNVNRRDFAGFQGAGITDLTLGRFAGFQASGIFNLTREMTGFQGAGIANAALGDVSGFQGAGISNVALGDVSGFRGAGIANIALGDARGFQGAGIANVSRSTTGFQGAGIANVAHGDARGVQAAGIANVSTGEVTGAQIGLINYGAKVKGAQIGLINIATKEMKGAPIGLVNYAGDGVFAPTFWMADSSLLNLGMKMGSKHVYGLFGCGAHPLKMKRFSWIAGVGGHIELKSDFWLELDILHNALHGEHQRWRDYEIDYIEQARINAGYRFGDQLSVYLGPSLNLLASDVRNEVGVIPAVLTEDRDDTRVALSIGLTAGIQWEPRFGQVNSWK
jgi:hypothetical protein